VENQTAANKNRKRGGLIAMAEGIYLIDALGELDFDDSDIMKINELSLPIGFRHRVLKNVLKKTRDRPLQKRFPIKRFVVITVPTAIVLIVGIILFSKNLFPYMGITSGAPWTTPTPVIGLSPQKASDVRLSEETVTVSPGLLIPDFSTGFYNYTVKLSYKISALKDGNELFYLPCLTIPNMSVTSSNPSITVNGMAQNFNTIYAGNLKSGNLTERSYSSTISDSWLGILKLDPEKTIMSHQFTGNIIKSYDEIISAYNSQFVNPPFQLNDTLEVYKFHPQKDQQIAFSIPKNTTKPAFYLAPDGDLRAYGWSDNGDGMLTGTLTASGTTYYYIVVAKDTDKLGQVKLSVGNETLIPVEMTLADLIKATAGNNIDLDNACKVLTAQLNAVDNGAACPIRHVSIPYNTSQNSLFYAMNSFNLSLKKGETITIEINYSLKSELHGIRVKPGFQLFDSASSDWASVGKRILSITPGIAEKLSADSSNGAIITNTAEGKNYSITISDGMMKEKFEEEDQ
jgi:hypothetical protein